MNAPFCVIKNKAFYDEAKKLNISVEALERLTHKYVNETGESVSFAPASYVNSQYEGKNIVAKDEYEELHRVWVDFYSAPVYVQTLDEAEKIKKKHAEVFSEEAIVIIPLYNDTYKVVVAVPQLGNDSVVSTATPAFEGEIGSYSDEGAQTWGDFNEDAPKEEPKTVSRESAYQNFVKTQAHLNSIIKFDADTHTYYINGRKADFSVTEFKDFLLGSERNSSSMFLQVASRLGSAHDEVLRDFFNNSMKSSYPNISSAQLATLRKSAAKLKIALQKQYGNNCIFITDENLLKVAGTISYDGKSYTVAGTLDMVVIDEKGVAHIVDFKTHRANRKAELTDVRQNEYSIQLSLYKKFLQTQGIKVADDTKIALFNIKYGDPADITYSFKGPQVLVTIGSKTLNVQDVKATPDGKNAYVIEGIHSITELSNDLSELTITSLKTGLQARKDAKEVAKTTIINPQSKVPVTSEKEIEISSYNRKYNLLSNFGNKPFEVDGVVFPTVEHYFQYKKARFVGDYKMANVILKTKTAMTAKQLGSHKLSMTEEQQKEWNKVSRRVMKRGMSESLSQNENAKDLLLSTGNALLTHRYGGPMADILMELREEYGGFGKPITEKEVIDKGKETANLRIKIAESTTVDVKTISIVTKRYGVTIDNDLIKNWKTWLENNTEGIVAYRVNKTTFNTPESVEKGIIGNPFDWQKYGTEEATQMFMNWLTTGENFGEELATEEFRDAIIEKLNNTESPNILYYKELGKPSHATVLGYLINHKELLFNSSGKKETRTTKSTPKLTDEQKAQIEQEELEAAKAKLDSIKKAASETVVPTLPEYTGIAFNVVSQSPIEDVFTSSYTITLNRDKDGEEFRLSKEDRIKELSSLINSIPFSSSLELSTEDATLNYLYSLDVLLGDDRVFPVYGAKTIFVDPDSREGKFAKHSRLNYNSKTGELRVPVFTIGYTYYEIRKRKSREALLKSSLLTNSELRNLSKATVYKVSEIITHINSYSNGYEKYFNTSDTEWENNPLKDTDFTKLSRIEIINLIGLKNLFNIVKERVFNTELSDAEIGFDTLDKMDLIYNNWEAFIEFGYDTLIGLEEVGLDTRGDKTIEIKNDLNGDLSQDEESEDIIQEIFGDALEHWQVGFRQVSAVSSLSQLMKRFLDTLYEVDENGEIKLDEFGMGIHLNVQEAVSKILYFTQGAVSLDGKTEDGNLSAYSMLNMLKNRVDTDPWLNQVIDALEDKYDEEGNITKKADEQFKALFFSNFKKYFQKYAVTYKKGKGKNAQILIKIINESQASDSLLLSSQAKENSYALGGFKLKNTNGELNKTVVEELSQLSERFSTYYEKAKKAGELKDLIDLEDYHKDIKDALDLLGIDAPVDVSLFKLFGVKKNLEFFNQHLLYFTKYLKGTVKPGENVTSNGDYKRIVSLIAKELDTEMESVSYEAGKLYYSYVLPSYLNNLITNLKSTNLTESEYEDFINSEYLQYRWFYKDGKIRNRWLKRLINSKTARENLEHVCSLHYLQTEYTDKTEPEYIASMMKMYFYDDAKKWAYFRVPMMSNKPSEEYIKFERVSLDFKNTITDYLFDVFEQEIDRITAVLQRAGELTDRDGNKTEPIENHQKITSKGKKSTFDKNGREFCFLDWVQTYFNGSYKERKQYNNLSEEEKLQEARFEELLNKKIYSELSEEQGESAELIELFNIITKRSIDEKYQLQRELWAEQGFIVSLKEDGSIEELYDGAKYSESQLEEFFWNDLFAQTQILELTIADMALYVDTEDLQKRLAQLHAPGMRANILARDVHGNLYSKDGKARFVILKDDIVKSSSMTNLEDAVKKIISDTPDSRRAYVTEQLNGILDAFRGINFADAQGYSCPSSYRKKMGMFGKWDSRMEQAYEKIIHPELYPDVQLSDLLDVLWQPLKPFVYSQISTPGYNDFLPTIKTGIQIKDSEYVLIMADALLRRAGLPNRLSAIYDFMEASQHDSAGNLNGEGIDTVVFMSAVNTGCTGVIDLNDSRDKKGNVIKQLSEEEIKAKLQVSFLEDGSYNPDFVKEINFRDYMIQQDVPIHFRGHSQAHGSQDRILTFTDIYDFDPRSGSENFLVIDGKRVSVRQAKEDYFNAIAQNIEDSFKDVSKRFNLDSADRRTRNVALSRLLKDEILKDSRFGYDLLWACDTNEFGEFNISLSDPIQSNRIQQLLNSIIKNSINKQVIAGGPVVQVSSWGTSDQLHIRWKNSEGQLLLTEEEFNSGNYPEDYESEYQPITDEKTYTEYLYDQAWVAYFECYATLPDGCIAEDFTSVDEFGNEFIDMKKIKEKAPKLLDMVSYRIPTESKYSMCPLKIKGFLPNNGGEALMLPAEITTLAGSDFDIDKDYIMRYEFIRKETKDGVEYIFPTEGRAGRNNLIVSTQLAVLRSEQVQPQLITPGNFDAPKEYGYLISYVQNEAKRTGKNPADIYNECLNVGKTLSTEDFIDWLKDKNKTHNNLIYNYTQVKFHKQNMVAGKMIGIFAQGNVSHGFLSLYSNTTLEIPNANQFTLDGVFVGGSYHIDENLTNNGKILISSNIAAFLAASVDAVKDPILNLVNINTATANVVVALLRMGFDIETISLLCSQPVLKNLVKEYEIANTIKFTPITEIIQAKLIEFSSDVQSIESVNLNKNDLINNLDGSSEITNYLVLKLFLKMQAIASTFGDITHMTRYNSVTSAVGPFASDTVSLRMKDKAFFNNEMISDKVKEACGALLTEDLTWSGNPILIGFRTASDRLERAILGENIIQAGNTFNSALVTLGRYLGYERGVPSKVGNAFADFYMSYYVNGNPDGSVFDLSFEHRKDILTSFPSEFLKLKTKYSNNIFVNSVQFTTSDNEEFPYLVLKTRGLSSTATEDLKQAWAELYLNPESQNLALKLVEYWFFRGSFGFSPKTSINLTPNVVKLGLFNYISTLNNKSSVVEDNCGDYIHRIIKQFILHNPKLISERYRNLEDFNPTQIDLENGKTALIVSRKSKDKTILGTHLIITIDNKPYVVHDNNNPEEVQLIPVNFLGGEGQGFEISLTEDYPSSVYSKEFTPNSRHKKFSTTQGGQSALTEDDLRVIINSLFISNEELQEFIDISDINERLNTLNQKLEEGGYTYRVPFRQAIIRKRLNTLISSLKKGSILNARDIISKSEKTIDDLNLC